MSTQKGLFYLLNHPSIKWTSTKIQSTESLSNALFVTIGSGDRMYFGRYVDPHTSIVYLGKVQCGEGWGCGEL